MSRQTTLHLSVKVGRESGSRGGQLGVTQESTACLFAKRRILTNGSYSLASALRKFCRGENFPPYTLKQNSHKFLLEAGDEHKLVELSNFSHKTQFQTFKIRAV